ncbi:MAG TPA: MBL fold metallo-hydrolase [Cyanobacteria bacterium UBA8803]|nr:MBL fold metallo-hydrolase [Cyanobacteria bacterium UBA9273]HBL62394.1 MBL fold metallo-hydrolase [Cyanobacteria bacterium UBA8803]
MNRLRHWIVLWLVTLVTFVGAISWHGYSQAQSSPNANLTLETAGLTLEELGSGVYGLIASTDFPPQNPNAAICNGGIVIGTDGVLVIDPFQNAALANLLFSTVEDLTDQPIRYVLNTHYHFDHTGGNRAAKARGILIVGRGPIREFMIERNKERDPDLTPPNLVLNSESTIWLGDRQVQLAEVEGHSGGTDLVAYVPDAKVLFTGDILFHQRIPYVSDGDIRKWQSSLSQLIANYPDARVLPGHGPITDRRGLESLKGYFDNLERLALSWQQQSLTQAQVLARFAEVPAPYKDYKFHGLYQGNLETAYQQITLGEN